jgi:hypothetical protein
MLFVDNEKFLQAYIWLQVLIILLPMLLLRNNISNNILSGAGWVVGWVAGLFAGMLGALAGFILCYGCVFPAGCGIVLYVVHIPAGCRLGCWLRWLGTFTSSPA